MEIMSLINIALILSTAVLFVLAIELKNLIHASILLGTGSAVLACVFFIAGAPFAAVFELVVGAGLITVLFVSAISLTKPGGDGQ
ncbi:MAG: hypothetical protein PHU53_03620 [Thermoplasmata archaeon]|nr:hypothetical protein [Thermoplasmata archaeon]